MIVRALAVVSVLVLAGVLLPVAGPAVAAVECRGRTATIVGTDGDDRLVGTNRDDVIAALGGDDDVWAGAGDDLVCGGPGDDQLRGRRGADRLYGDGGDDTLLGGRGPDRLAGGRDDDTLLGERGSDLLRGGAGRDVLRGGRESDRLFGGGWADLLLGEGADDRLDGGGGPDRCRQGQGTGPTVRCEWADFGIEDVRCPDTAQLGVTVTCDVDIVNLGPSADRYALGRRPSSCITGSCGISETDYSVDDPTPNPRLAVGERTTDTVDVHISRWGDGAPPAGIVIRVRPAVVGDRRTANDDVGNVIDEAP